MVVLTIVAQKNGETVYFDEPIPQVHFMRLVSCSLYNSWHNLKTVGVMSIKQTDEPVASIPEGNYTVMSLAKELMESLKKYKTSGVKIEIDTNMPNSVLKINRLEPKQNSNRDVSVSHTLASFMGNGIQLAVVTHIRKLYTPSAYFIHCDLIDRSKNFFNGKRSDVFAKFDIRGLPYDKVSYLSLPQEALRECSTGQHVKQITLSVKDQSGELFDFKGLPLEFVLELN